jgi:asparagine synthase (glutamine-hydrolysing)
LPAAVVNRPKQGFTLPFDAWMRGDLRDATRDGLQTLAVQGWIDASAPAAVWSAFERGHAHWSRAWGLGMLGRFLTEAP